MTSLAAVISEVNVKRDNPSSVILLEQRNLPSIPPPNHAFIKMLAAPINPSDINILEGVYAYKPELPITPGYEGLGEVLVLGDSVSNVQVGDHVIFANGFVMTKQQSGTWCQMLDVDTKYLVKVPKDIPIETACMLFINPVSAYRMLEAFVALKENDWIIQNASNSAVGLSVIQIAKARGIKTLNTVRNSEWIPILKTMGADIVVTEEIPLSQQIQILAPGAQFKLGLNAVGGKSAREISKCLSASGTLVTYGAMSKEPLEIPNSLLIFKDIRFLGYSIARDLATLSNEVKQKTIADLIDMARSGKLKINVEKCYPLQQVKEAVTHAIQSGRKGKIILLMQ